VNKESIRPIAICLFRRGARILVSEAYDSSKQEYFCRPPGGGVEFGEPSRDAVRREIREELGAEIEGLELLGVLENIFLYEGAEGHEIVFVYDAHFTDKRMYELDELQGYEQEIDARFVARWYTPDELREKNVRLVPEGLTELLAGLNK